MPDCYFNEIVSISGWRYFMKILFHRFLEQIDPDFLMTETENLWKKEFGQTFRDYRAAAFYTKDLMERVKIPNVELHEFPADGKTVMLDARMPIAWDATVGKLTLLNVSGSCISGEFGGTGPEIVVADYQKHPFTLVKGSVLNGGKRYVRIITTDDLLGGCDPKDALVILPPAERAVDRWICPVLDLGALGFITDGVEGGTEHPDVIGWMNAATEDGDWHVTAKHRDFLAFSISPRLGAFIRKQIRERGALSAFAECDGCRYDGAYHTVTALIPGRQKKEVWAYAHLYEPLCDDDSAGVIATIEIAKQIMKMGTPEFSIRLVFSMELYGYLAYIDSLGGNLRDRVVGGCNLDSIACVKNASLRSYRSPAGTPFYGNFLMDELNEDLQSDPNRFEYKDFGPAYHDDMAYAVPSIGLPVVWCLAEHGDDHHCSRQTIDFIDRETFLRGTAYHAALVSAIANPTEDMFQKALPLAEKRISAYRDQIRSKSFGNDLERFRYLCGVEKENLLDFKRLMPDLDCSKTMAELNAFCAGLEDGLNNCDPDATSKWRSYASRLRMRYTAVGFPVSTAKLDHRLELPGGSIYGTIANILADLHQEMSLSEAIRKAEYEVGKPLSESAVRKIVNVLNLLADHGYLHVSERPELTKDEIVRQ